MEKNIPEVKLGMRENWKQFFLLVIINGFVGGMIGLERSILPRMAEAEFDLELKTAVLSFIIVFGITKAITNYYTGALAAKLGRRKLLIVGWLFAIPVPFILIYAPNWNWVIAANIFLGINQGLAWSTTVLMKIDLVGNKNRGLAMGFNEFSGYLAVGLTALATGWIASEYGIRPYPFYVGIGLTILGLSSSIFLVKDTHQHLAKDSLNSKIPLLKNIFWETTWKNKSLGSVSFAGLVNNLNDGMIWGILPFILAVKGFSIEEIGVIAAVYPSVWGIGQLVTGKMADRFCKKNMLYIGMFLQSVALLFFVWAENTFHFVGLSILLGWGTAMVYPTFLATVAQYTHPEDRAKSLGIFRFWRDLGYAIGAILTGLIADAFGKDYAIFFVAGLTFLAAYIIFHRMSCKEPGQ